MVFLSLPSLVCIFFRTFAADSRDATMRRLYTNAKLYRIKK